MSQPSSAHGTTILLVAAVEAEIDAALRQLGEPTDVAVGEFGGRTVETPAGRLDAFATGLGPVAAAVATATLLATREYDVVLNAGIAGGFRGRVEIGDVVLADTETFADLGVRTDDGFLSPHEMGFDQDSTLAFGNTQLIDRMQRAPVRVAVGGVLTLSCMTGTDAAADAMAARYPRALAEGMEGFGVVAAARANTDIRCVAELRAISNLIGRRDRATWDIPAAFESLADAVATFVKEPLP
jgi:futalosine hydrolase